MKHLKKMKPLVRYPVALFLYSAALHGEPAAPPLHLPLDCVPGKTCFIQNYVDADPSAEYHDYTCGFLTYNDHTGTDFRLPDHKVMHAGVQVLAAAPGVVRAVRDGMPDISVKKIDSALIKNREAGNSVAITHGNGWETQYSHLKQGSVLVKSGDRVDTGQPLAVVGMSGNTEFPHLHFTVRHKGEVLDPFTGNQTGQGCGQTTEGSLWHVSVIEQLDYQPSGVLTGGFTDRFPKLKPYYEYLEKKDSLTQDAEKIIFWVNVFGSQKGDRQHMVLLAPDGNVLAETKMVLDKNQAQWLAVLGKKHNGSPWPEGVYTGKYLLKRSDDENQEIIIEDTFEFSIGDRPDS